MPCTSCGSSGSPAGYQNQVATSPVPMTGVGGFLIVEWAGQVPVRMVIEASVYEFTETRRRGYMDGDHYRRLAQAFRSLTVIGSASVPAPDPASPDMVILAEGAR